MRVFQKLHPKNLKSAIFGVFDGLSAALGVTIPAAFVSSVAFREALGVAMAEFVGMGLGEWLSESDKGFSSSIIIGIASALGVLSPAIPFLFLSGLPAIGSSAGVLVLLGAVIALARSKTRGIVRAFVETYGLLAITYLTVWASSKI